MTPGDASGLVLLTQVKPITVIFTLPEDYIPAVLRQLGATGAKIARCDAWNRDDTIKLATGTLSTVDNTVDPTTGTFKLRATFTNDDEALFPNQFVNAAMLLDVERGDTVISTSAIERGQQGSFVYVVGGRQQGVGEERDARRHRGRAGGGVSGDFGGGQGRGRRR